VRPPLREKGRRGEGGKKEGVGPEPIRIKASKPPENGSSKTSERGGGAAGGGHPVFAATGEGEKRGKKRKDGPPLVVWGCPPSRHGRPGRLTALRGDSFLKPSPRKKKKGRKRKEKKKKRRGEREDPGAGFSLHADLLAVFLRPEKRKKKEKKGEKKKKKKGGQAAGLAIPFRSRQGGPLQSPRGWGGEGGEGKGRRGREGVRRGSGRKPVGHCQAD